jgi:glycosyltransferase involved in cell wall biosynthesis
MVTEFVVRRSMAISTVSDELRRVMKSAHIQHSNFIITYNAVDCERFCPITLPTSSRKVFAHISCFDDKAKNVTGLIRAIYELSKKRDDFICLMVGDGSDKIEMEKLADQLSIKDKAIKFTGLKEGEELVNIYNQSLFTVLFSNFENMPVVIPESFACGKPVIATKVGGIPEIVNDSNGMLIAPGNEDELMKAIHHMLDHYAEFDVNIIRDFAIQYFGKKSVLDQLLQLYAPVLNRHYFVVKS